MVDIQTRNPNITNTGNISKIERDASTLAIIPTGEIYRGKEKTENFKQRLCDLGFEISLYLPNMLGQLINTDENLNFETKCIREVHWSHNSTHSPEVRAEMLYDAIFNKNIKFIHITGGRGNEYTIIELNKLIAARKPQIPQKLPIVYGMSDATNMLNYLGQRGLVIPCIGAEIFEPFYNKPLKQNIEYTKNNQGTERNDNLKGVLIPEYSLRSYGTLQEMKLYKNKVNFLATEINFRGEVDALIEFYENIKLEDRKNIIFCMSAVGKTRPEDFKKQDETGQNKAKRDELENNEIEIINSILKDEENNIIKFEKKEKEDKTTILIITKEQKFAEKGKTKQKETYVIEGEENIGRCQSIYSIIKGNIQKEKEQEKFKDWCFKNGFDVVDKINFGHGNKNNQYELIPSYCECNLNGNTIEYSFNFAGLPTETIQLKEKTLEQKQETTDYLDFNKNYIAGGGTEVSYFVKPTKNMTTIFSQKGLLQPNANGEFHITFDKSSERRWQPKHVYIQDLERVLKDIDKLEMKGLKTIHIHNFDISLDEPVDLSGKRIGERVIKETVSYISKNYPNLKDVKINLGNGLEFKNGTLEKSKSACMIL